MVGFVKAKFDIRLVRSQTLKKLPKVPPPIDRVGLAVTAVLDGYTITEAARHFGCSRMAIYNRLRAMVARKLREADAQAAK